MRKILILIIIPFFIYSCKPNNSLNDKYALKLSLNGFADSTKFNLLDLDKGRVVDSALIIDGALEFNGSVDEPVTARIHTIDNKYLILWLENKDISIEGDYDNFSSSKITGTELNEIMCKYRDLQIKHHNKRDSLMQTIMHLISQQTNEAEYEIQNLSQQISKIDREIFDIRVKSIINESPSLFTIKELYFLRNDFSKDSLRVLFDRFPDNLQKTKYGEVINVYISNESIDIGDQYMDIKGVDIKGNTRKLSDLEGKLILLDFWASWCGPCRTENPNLVKLYNEYNKNGFEIYSFSTDNNRSSWERAISEDSMVWTNVIDLNGSYSKMSALYGVRAIPASFLINPEGTIIAKNLRGQALQERIAEELKK